MKILGIDHLVITTENLENCLYFYTHVLDMEAVEKDGRWALYFGNEKFNLHTRKAEFLPAARNPEYGSLDLCLRVDGAIEQVQKEIRAKGWPIELGPITRHGALGAMESLYLRDPDGNLIELCFYNKKDQSEAD